MHILLNNQAQSSGDKCRVGSLAKVDGRMIFNNHRKEIYLEWLDFVQNVDQFMKSNFENCSKYSVKLDEMRIKYEFQLQRLKSNNVNKINTNSFG